MPLTRLRHVAAGLVAAVAAIAFASPAGADPMDPIPGNGFFRRRAMTSLPGLYRNGRVGVDLRDLINDVPTQDSMCLWFTYSTPDANKDDVVATNMDIGPMYATINVAR